MASSSGFGFAVTRKPNSIENTCAVAFDTPRSNGQRNRLNYCVSLFVKLDRFPQRDEDWLGWPLRIPYAGDRAIAAASSVRQCGRERRSALRNPELNCNVVCVGEAKLRKAEAHEQRHPVLTMGVTLIQVGIAIAAIAIIARGQPWPWYAAIALGVVGALVGVCAYI